MKKTRFNEEQVVRYPRQVVKLWRGLSPAR
jgi:hypothetical protein